MLCSPRYLTQSSAILPPRSPHHADEHNFRNALHCTAPTTPPRHALPSCTPSCTHTRASIAPTVHEWSSPPPKRLLTLKVWSWLPVTSRPAAAFSAVMGFWWAQETVWVSWHTMTSLLLNTGEDGMLLLLGAPAVREHSKSSLQLCV